MTKDEIIEMARQAGFEHIAEANYWHPLFAKFAELVAQHEREACARVCDEAAESMTQMAQWGAQTCGKLIKARGQA